MLMEDLLGGEIGDGSEGSGEGGKWQVGLKVSNCGWEISNCERGERENEGQE